MLANNNRGSELVRRTQNHSQMTVESAAYLVEGLRRDGYRFVSHISQEFVDDEAAVAFIIRYFYPRRRNMLQRIQPVVNNFQPRALFAQLLGQNSNFMIYIDWAGNNLPGSHELTNQTQYHFELTNNCATLIVNHLIRRGYRFVSRRYRVVVSHYDAVRFIVRNHFPAVLRMRQN
jgi:hypothetical protein